MKLSAPRADDWRSSASHARIASALRNARLRGTHGRKKEEQRYEDLRQQDEVRARSVARPERQASRRRGEEERHHDHGGARLQDPLDGEGQSQRSQSKGSAHRRKARAQAER